MPCEPFDRVVHGQRVTGMVCSDRRRRRCAFCRAWSTKLCDGPPPAHSKRNTCDAPICSEHATHLQGQDIDYCPRCAPLVRHQAQLDFGLGE